MGMFDYVNAPAITCDCGAEVSGWQSKDGDCTLGLIDPASVSNYYSYCPACRTRHSFDRAWPVNPWPPFTHSTRSP